MGRREGALLTEMTNDLRQQILRIARRKVVAGHVIGTCQAAPDSKAANPVEGYCLRGALEKAAIEAGIGREIARDWSEMANDSYGLNLKGLNACSFSDSEGKVGCLEAIDQVLNK